MPTTEVAAHAPVSELNQHVTEQLRWLTREHRTRQRDIASLLGYSEATVSRKLSGTSEWRISDVQEFGRYFDVDPQFFFERADGTDDDGAVPGVGRSVPNLHYVDGDATDPVSLPAVIVHICNDAGRWGRGFVLALSRRTPAPERAYKRWYQERERDGNDFGLGAAQLVVVEPGRLYVANIIAQAGTGPSASPRVRYGALASGLEHAVCYAQRFGATIHMPRIGTGLGGGSWDKVEPVIERCIQGTGVQVYVYDLPGS